MGVVNTSTRVTSAASDRVVNMLRDTKVTMRWRLVESSQSSRNLKAPSRNCKVTKGMSSRHQVKHRS